jgi:hypothetical protein
MHSTDRKEYLFVSVLDRFFPPAAPSLRPSSGSAIHPRPTAPSKAQWAVPSTSAFGPTAASRPHRIAPDTLPRRPYPSPPSTAPTGTSRPALGVPAMASLSGSSINDEGARARASLIDRERRQVFSFLSSPNCFLFAAVAGPVALTEEDLDLLLAAGGTSVWALAHLRALDAAGQRFSSFEQLIPAVQAAAQRQAELNKQVLAWLTGPSCTLFGVTNGGDGNNGSSGAGGMVLLSMADVERLVIESQAGLDTLVRVQALQAEQVSGTLPSFDSFQQLITAVRDAQYEKESGGRHHRTGSASSASRGHKTRASLQLSQGSVSQETTHADAASIAASTQQHQSGDVIGSDDRRLVLEYLSSPSCSLFSQAHSAVVATAADLDQLIGICSTGGGGGGAQAVESLMRLDQAGLKFIQFADILPTLIQQHNQQGTGTSAALKPLLTSAQIAANRALIHSYLSSNECLLFSQRAEPLQATGRDFDQLVDAAGGDAHECVRLMRKLDSGVDMHATARLHQQEEKESNVAGMRFQNFAELLQAVTLAARAASITHSDSNAVGRSDGSAWTAAERDAVLAWLASPACTLFASMAPADVEVHLRQLDLLMDIGGVHTLHWLLWMAATVPVRTFASFSDMSQALSNHVSEMRSTVLPKLLLMLSKPSCPLFHAPNGGVGVHGGKGQGRTSGTGTGTKSKKKGQSGPVAGTGSAVAAKVTRGAVEELVFSSGALLDTPTLLEGLVREGRSFPSLHTLQVALAQAHTDRRALAFVSDADRAAIVDFISKESCVLFADDSRTGNSIVPGDLHVRKSELDRLIVEGKGANMCLFHLSALNASGRQFNAFADLIPAVRAAHAQSAAEQAELFDKLQMLKAQLFPIHPTANLQQQQHQQQGSAQQFGHQNQKDGHTQHIHPHQTPDSLLPNLTLSDAASLYMDGSAGSATSSYLDVFVDSGTRFSSWQELVQAVRDLHAQVLRNRYACAALERAEARLSAQERRNILLAYLYSPECTLFSDAEDVNVSDQDLDTLQQEAVGSVAGNESASGSNSTGHHPPGGCALALTLLFLRYIDWTGRKFQSFAPLRSAIRDCYLASLRQKKAILDHLRAGIDLPSQLQHGRGGLLSNPGFASPTHNVSGSHVCKLLSTTAAHLQRTLSPRDVDRLYLSGGAGPTTLSYLLDLEDQGVAFASLDALIHAVGVAHQQAQDTRQTEKAMLLAYLGSSNCTLLQLPTAAGILHTSMLPPPAAAAAVAAANAAASAVAPKTLSDMELVTLLNVGRGGVATLYFLQGLAGQGKHYASFPELLAALKEVRETSANLRKKECAAFLRHDRCTLLRDLERTPLTSAAVDRLFLDGCAGAATLPALWSLQVGGHSFASVDSLSQGVKVAHEAGLTRAGSERTMLLVHLLGAASGGVLRPTAQGLAPLFWLKLSTDEIDAVLLLCEGGANALRFLLELARAHRTFDSWPALMDALAASHAHLAAGRAQLLNRLSDPEQCTLFNTSSATGAQIQAFDVHALTLADMDLLTVRTQDARKTLFLLDAFESRRSRFSSFADLASAVNQAHANTMASIRQEKTLIYMHLTAPSCSLLAPMVAAASAADPSQNTSQTNIPHILEPELDQLFLIAGSASGTLFYLQQLESTRRSYASVTGLIADVERLHRDATRVKGEALAFFHAPNTRILFPAVGNGAGGGMGVTPTDIDRLYVDSGAGLELLPLLRSLEAAGSRFVSIIQVGLAVRDLAHRRAAATKEQRLLILSFLSRPDCRLFHKPVAAKAKDIDSLIAAGGGDESSAMALRHAQAAASGNPVHALTTPAAQTLEMLRELESAQSPDAHGFDSFPALIDAVASIRAESEAQREAVLAFLQSPRCFLFKDAPSDVRVDAAAVAHLFAQSGAGAATIEHVRSLALAGGRFGSFFTFDELVEAVRAMHQQSIQQQREDRAAEQEGKTGRRTNATNEQFLIEEQRALDRAALLGDYGTLSPKINSNSDADTSIPITLPVGSIAELLAFMQHPLRRLFHSGAPRPYIGVPEAEMLIDAAGTTPAGVMRLLVRMEAGAVSPSNTVGDLCHALQQAAHKETHDRRAIAAFLASHKCQLQRVGRSAAGALLGGANPQYTDGAIEELVVHSGVGSGAMVLHHLHCLNEDASVNAPDLLSLTALVSRAHSHAADTFRALKQMVRTYLSSFHSQLLWCTPHDGVQVTGPAFRHHLSDADLTQLLLESGGSGATLLRHLMRIDDMRLSAAAAAPIGTPLRSYHAVADLIHAVRDMHHHELQAKRDLLDVLNAPGCTLWTELPPLNEHYIGSGNAPTDAHQARIVIHEVDRLFDGSHARFDAPFLIGLLAAEGRQFPHAAALCDAVKEQRLRCAHGVEAEALALLAHFTSPLSTVLPKREGGAISSIPNAGAQPIATMEQLLSLIRAAGGSGSAVLFEVHQLEAGGWVARDWEQLVDRVRQAASGPSADTREQLLMHLSEESTLFKAAANTLHQLYGENGPIDHAGSGISTDSLSVLPVTTAGVTRLLEESSCGLVGVLPALRSMERARSNMSDLRSLVDALQDLHASLPLLEYAIESRRTQLHADRAQQRVATRESRPLPPAGHFSRWTEDDRRQLLSFLSHRDCLLFSEAPSQLEVTAALLDRVLEATDPEEEHNAAATNTSVALNSAAVLLGAAAIPQHREPPSTQEALVLLAHLNQSARKLSSLEELVGALEREHATLRNVAADVSARLLAPDCALWIPGKSPLSTALTPQAVRRSLLLDTHVGISAIQRLDELELSGHTYASVSQLAAALSDAQQTWQARMLSAKDSLVSHLSRSDVAGQLFSQSASMTDVDVAALLSAGRGGASNVISVVDAARSAGRKFINVAELLTAVRMQTQRAEQEFLNFLQTPQGASLLPPHSAERMVAFLNSHLLSCMSHICGSADAGLDLTARAQGLAEARCTFARMSLLIDALRDPHAAIRKQQERQLAESSSSERASHSTVSFDAAAPIMPRQVDVDALVLFLSDPSMLLFADSSEDLKIETDDIAALFAAGVASNVNKSNPIAVTQEEAGSWAGIEPFLRGLNSVHRRFISFIELAPAVRAAIRSAPSGADASTYIFCSTAQLDELNVSLRTDESLIRGLFAPVGTVRDPSSGQVQLNGIQGDKLLRCIPPSSLAGFSAVADLLAHLRAFALGARLFSTWEQVYTALESVIANPTQGHLSEAEQRAVHSFFHSPDNKLFPLVAAPHTNQSDSSASIPSITHTVSSVTVTGADIDALVAAAGSTQHMMDALHTINARTQEYSIPSVERLVEEVAAVRRNAQIPAAAASPSALSKSAPTRRASFVSTVPTSSPPLSLIPAMSAEDQQLVSEYLSSDACQLFSESHTELEVSVESLDALAFECGSVRDLIDLLKSLDKQHVKFLTFSEVPPRVQSELLKRRLHEPVGVEPIVRAPSNPPSAQPSPLTAPNTNTHTVETATLHPDVQQSTLTATAPLVAQTPSNSAPITSPVADGVSEEDRSVFIDWLQSDACLFFSADSQLAVQVEDIDSILHIAGGVKNALRVLGDMSARGVRFNAFNEVLPALQQEIAHPRSEPAALIDRHVGDSEPTAPSVLSEAARNDVIAVLSDSHFFDDTEEPLEVDPIDLDILCTDAHGVAQLIAAIRILDARNIRCRNFRELFSLMRQHFASVSVHTTSHVPFDPTAQHPVIPKADAETLIAYISSEQCTLFSDSTEDLVVEPAALDALFAAGGSEIGAVINTLHSLDAVGRRFNQFDSLPSAVAEARASGSHIDSESSNLLIEYLGGEQCKLFDVAGGSDAMEISVESLDALIASAHGIDATMHALRALEAQGTRVHKFDELIPLVREFITANTNKSIASATDAVQPIS